MKLISLVLCITYCSIAYAQENGEAILQGDLEDFVRRLTQQPVRTTRNFHSAFLPDNFRSPTPQESYEETSRRVSAYMYPSQGGNARAEAFATANVKRPFEDEEESADAMFGSLKDVNEEENLAQNLDFLLKSTKDDDILQTSPMQFETTDDAASDANGPYHMMHQQVETVIRKEDDSFSDVYFVAIVSGCCAVGIFGIISAGVVFYRLQKSRKAAADVDYPAYGVTGPCKDVISPNGDRKLAQSAQMYHYQHQKQQMIAVEKAGSTKNTSASDVDSEEENEEGDYTVYECPGLAPTGEMEVKNPLFHDDSTPVSPPVLPPKDDSHPSN